MGDTVDWTSNSAEPHTVTFLAPGTTLPAFNPFDPSMTDPQGSAVYDGTAYTNSGILATQPIFIFNPAASYHLTFTATGDFTYYCLLHGVMMTGTVHVRPAGTAYPYTQLDYNRVGNQQAQAGLFAGRRAWSNARQTQATTGSSVLVGVEGDGFGVMRFVRDRVVVHVGDTVSFVAGPGAPHTVTFGQEPPGLGILFPSGDPTHYAGGDLNSGALTPGAPFDVTFTTAGRFHYICAIHDDMGMVGDVVVVPSPTRAGSRHRAPEPLRAGRAGRDQPRDSQVDTALPSPRHPAADSRGPPPRPRQRPGPEQASYTRSRTLPCGGTLLEAVPVMDCHPATVSACRADRRRGGASVTKGRARASLAVVCWSRPARRFRQATRSDRRAR